MTKQRTVILNVLRGRRGHYTADEIYALAKEALPSISRATVYNNLTSLAEEHAIRRLSGIGSADLFDSTYEQHAHLFCDVCGGVEDLWLPPLKTDIERAVGGEIDSYELKIVRTCKHCLTN